MQPRRNAISGRPDLLVTNDGAVECRLLGAAAEVDPGSDAAHWRLVLYPAPDFGFVEALQDDFQRRGVSKVDMGVNLSSFPVTARKAYGFHERQTVVALGTRPRFIRYNAIGNVEVEMARGGLLWLLGIPIPILLLMWAFGWLH
jgi:hypothetical protein